MSGTFTVTMFMVRATCAFRVVGFIAADSKDTLTVETRNHAATDLEVFRCSRLLDSHLEPHALNFSLPRWNFRKQSSQ